MGNYKITIYEQDTHKIISKTKEIFNGLQEAIFYGDNEIGKHSNNYYEIFDEDCKIYTSMV